VSLLAIAVYQTHRYREQAHSYKGSGCLVGSGLPGAAICLKLRASPVAANLDQQTGQH